jgi:hypothetical protein
MIVTAILLFLSGAAYGADLVAIDVVEAGGSDPVDTLYTGLEYEFRIWLENDATLGGICHGFKFLSPDGVTWTWLSQGGGYGNHAAATIVPGCRMDPPNSIWDMTDMRVSEYDVNGNSPDTFLIGGASMFGGMSAGSLEHMISLHCSVEGPEGDQVWTLCIDSTFVPLYGEFLYSFPSGSGVTPGVNWSSGGFCFSVKAFPNDCPAWDDGLPSSLETNHCLPGQVDLTATDTEQDSIIFTLGTVTGGAGLAEVDDHGDGTMTLTYTPDASDVGADIDITVNVTDTFHVEGACESHTVAVTVTNTSPMIDCGMPVYIVNEGNNVIKSDIRSRDEDGCDDLTYMMISGNGSIDPVSGIYTWPAATGIGQWPVTVAITDSYDTAQCGFVVDVQAAVADTCAQQQQYPGDVNNDLSISIHDITYLVNFLYKGGAAPAIMANADPNGDCYIDEADLEYLAATIYTGGPPPVTCTCVNPFLCPCYIADANNDGSLNVGDAVYIINYVFKQGPAPDPYALCSGDANLDCTVNVGDAVVLINYVFKSGPRPPFCHEWIHEQDGCGWIVRK